MKIVLVRHGQPTVPLKGFYNAAEIKQTVIAYQNSVIQDVPPQQLYELFNDYYVVCSDLPRSVHSAEKIGFERVNYQDGVFSEAELPHFDQGKIRLPVTVWITLLRLLWLFGFKKNGESFKRAKKRANIAAAKLVTLATEHKNIILIGHGFMNWLIAKELTLLDWNGPASPGKKYWQFGCYKK